MPLDWVPLPSTGVSYTLELECLLAAVWANYTQEQFDGLSSRKRARIVAAYRVNNLAEAVAAFKRR